MWLSRILGSVSLLLFTCLFAVAEDSFHVVVNKGRNEPIRLKSYNKLEPGTLLSMPIDIEEVKIALDGRRAPRLRAITSENGTKSQFNTGDEIHVSLEYFGRVFVHGQPTLSLNTGCRSRACWTAEVQSFFCLADKGKFSLRLLDQFVLNIDVNTTAPELKRRLEELEGVERVSVYISSNNTNAVLRNQVCSSSGHNVTLNFTHATFPATNGDVPSIALNALNDDADLRHGRSQGDGTFLSRFNQRDKVTLSPLTTEVVKGVNRTDGLARYAYGNGTSKLTFRYVVSIGDIIDTLDVVSINFKEGFISSEYGSNVSTVVPTFGIGPRYLSSSASALSYTSPSSVTSTVAQVKSLSSPNASDTYTVGDVLFIDVVFDLAIATRSPRLFSLELDLGMFTRTVPFHSLVNTTVVRFRYAVEENDASPALEVVSNTSLALNGGKIYVENSVNEVDADILLPNPGEANSLSARQFVISTTKPVVISVTALEDEGLYTAGDLLNFEVLFNAPITVRGKPRFQLKNSPRPLRAQVRSVPFQPTFTYSRSLPGGIAQVLLKFTVNWDLASGDRLEVVIPQLVIRDENVADPRATPVTVFGLYAFSGYWNDTAKTLFLESSSFVPRDIPLQLLIEGRAGLFVSSSGLLADSSQYLTLITSSVESSLTDTLSFEAIEPVGFKSVSLTISPASYQANASISLVFETPENLGLNDSLSFSLPGFSNDVSTVHGLITIESTDFAFLWEGDSSSLRLRVLSDVAAVKSFTLPLSSSLFAPISFAVPDAGVNQNELSVSLSSTLNGELSSVRITHVTPLCSAPSDGSVSVLYLLPLPGALSPVRLSWTTGFYPLNTGDSVIFRLAHLALPSKQIDWRDLSLPDSDSVSVFVSGDQITVTALTSFPADSLIQIELSVNVGITVPLGGVISSRDSFSFQVVASSCSMSAARAIPYSTDAQVPILSNARFALRPDSLSFGARCAFDVVFALPAQIKAGDIVFVHLPNFFNTYTSSLSSYMQSNAALSVSFNKLQERLELTLLSDFSERVFVVNVTRDALFNTPVHGLANGAVSLSLSSGEIGRLEKLPVANDCIGFCSGFAQYSTLLTDVPSRIHLRFVYSESLPIGSVLIFDAPNMALSATENPSVAMWVNNSSFNGFSPPLMSGNRVSVTLSSAIPQSLEVRMEISGLEFISIASALTPPTISVADSRFSGTAVYEFPSPAVRFFPSMVYSNFTFDAFRKDRFTVVFNLLQKRTIAAENMMVLHLPKFTPVANISSYDGTLSLEGSIDDPLQVIDDSRSYFDANSETLSLFVRRTILDDEEVSLTVRGFNAPAEGLRKNSTAIFYTVHMGGTSELITPPTYFTTVEQYALLSNISFRFAFMPDSIKHLQSVTFSAHLTNGFAVGDIVFLRDMVSLNVRGANALANISLSVSTSDGSQVNGMWWGEEKGLLMKFITPSMGRSLSFSVDLSSHSFYIADSGIPAGTIYRIFVINNLLEYVANTTATLPCVGLCAVSLTPHARIPNRATAYTLSIDWQGFGMLPGDSLTLDLQGFTGSYRGVKTVSCLNPSLLRNDSFHFTWPAFNGTSILQMVFPVSADYTTETFSLRCELPQILNIIAPKTGVRSDSSYLVNMTYGVTETTKDYFSSDIASIPGIGAASISSLVIDPVAPDADVSLVCEFKFFDDLKVGDVITIYLPNFYVPSHPLPSTALSATRVFVAATSAMTTLERNVDGSLYPQNSIGFISVRLVDPLSAGEVLSFSLDSTVGIKSPPMGVYERPLPWFAVASESSSMSGSTFLNVTRIGTLNPSVYSFQTDLNLSLDNNPMLLSLKFTTSCPLFVNDSIVVSVSQIAGTLRQNRNMSVQLQSWNTTSSLSRAASFNVSYQEGLSTLTITVTEGYILSGQLFFDFLLYGFSGDTGIVYENDNRLLYSLLSDSCPVRNSRFSESKYNLVRSATIQFYPLDSLNGGQALELDLLPTIPIIAGDVLALRAVNISFQSSCAFSSACLVPWKIKSPESDSFASTFSVNNTVSRSVDMFIGIEKDIPAGSEIKLATYRNASKGFALLNSVANPQVFVFMRLLRGGAIVFQGPIFDVKTVAYQLSSSLTIFSPMASHPTSLRLSCSMSTAIPKSNIIQFYLPGFTLSLSASPAWEVVSDDAIQQFRVIFTASNHTLSLFPNIDIPAEATITVSIPTERGLITPDKGLPYIGESAMIALIDSGRMIFKENVISATVIPYVRDSSLAFLASDESKYFATGGDVHAIQLEPGHELNEGDIGSLIEIDNSLYTIADYVENVLYIEEEYVGTRVFLGSPNISVSSSPFEFAYYLSGNETDKLIFQYKVARGDSGTALELYSSSIDLNSGEMLRSSQAPVIPAILALPSMRSGDNRVVDTSIPFVERVFSSSPAAHAFGAGQFVDIIVRFSHNVVAFADKIADTPLGRMMLNFPSSGIQYAEYRNGSGSREIVFLYQVKHFDEEENLTRAILQDDRPFYYQPLRFIVSNDWGYLRRKSDIPLIDANLSVIHAAFDFHVETPQLLGRTAIVTSMGLYSLDEATRTKTFGAGDYIRIFVNFSDAVTVMRGSDNSSLPYIALDLGRPGSTLAYFSHNLSNSSLLFSYLVTEQDFAPNGLLLECTCADYLRRTFIHLNGSEIRTATNGFAAGLQLASDASIGSLMVDSEVTVASDSSTVIAISSNVTNAIAGTGDSIVIRVQYSTRVTVKGIISLLLKGQRSNCRAPFLKGNNTDTLHFIYHVSSHSGIGKLDCESTEAIDTSMGTIFRFAEIPTLRANNSLPLPGSLSALGRRESITIDTTDGKVKMIYLSDPPLSPVLTASSLDFNFADISSFDELYRQCGCEAWANDAQYSPSALEDFVQHNEKEVILQRNLTNLMGSLPYYERMLIANKYLQSLEFVPFEVTRCFQWWSSYNVQKEIDFVMEFNRPVLQEGLFVPLNISSVFNRAFSLSTSRHYQLLINLPPAGSANRVFAFKYAGQISDCITLSISLAGENSFVDYLVGIPSLRKFYPSARKTQVSSSSFLLDIFFSRALDSPLSLLTERALDGVCLNPASSAEVMFVSRSAETTLRYEIQHEDALVLRAKESLAQGEYQLMLSHVQLTEHGIEENSLSLKHYSASERLRSLSSVRNNAIARMTRSSLQFSSSFPGNESSVHIEICASQPFSEGDIVTVSLPSFSMASTQLPTGQSFAIANAHWDALSEKLRLVVGNASSTCLRTPSGSQSYNLTLPSQAIFRNDRRFSFSVNSSSIGVISDFPFQHVEPVGMADFSLNVSDPRPYFPTELNIHMEILHDLLPGNDTLQLFLPGFYARDSVRARVDVVGLLGDHFNVRWWNDSSTLFFSPLRRLPAGEYDFTVRSDVFALITSPSGISTLNPPSVSVKDPFWSFGFTPVVSFPLVFGYNSIVAEIDVNSRYNVDRLRVEVDVTNDIPGPAWIAITMPFLTHPDGFYQLRANGSQPTFDSATWFDFNKTWIVQSALGWSVLAQPITLDLVLNSSLNSSSPFVVNNQGVEVRDGVVDNTTTLSIYSNGGFLAPSPFRFVRGVPVIQHASVQFVNLEKDVFFMGMETILLSLKLNRVVQVPDVFFVKIDGVLFNLSRVIVNDNICFGIHNVNYDSAVNVTTIEIIPTNSSWRNCQYHSMYDFSLALSNVRVIESNIAISQYDFPFVSVAWTNSELASDFRFVDRTPMMGVYAAQLVFSDPYPNTATGVELKISTASSLRTNDEIVLSLEGFGCNIFTLSVLDRQGVLWRWNCASTAGSAELRIVVPGELSAAALSFKVAEKLLITPARGLSWADRETVKIGLRRSSSRQVIRPQMIPSLSPVGYIEGFHAALRRDHGRHSLSLSLTTRPALAADDKITLTFSALTFAPKTVIPVSAIDQSRFEVRSLDSKSLQIHLFQRLENGELFVDIPLTDSIQIDLAHASDLSVQVKIDSFLSPVKAHTGYLSFSLLENTYFAAKKVIDSSQSFAQKFAFSLSVLGIEFSFDALSPFAVGDTIELFLPSFVSIVPSSPQLKGFFALNDSVAGRVLWNVTESATGSLLFTAKEDISTTANTVRVYSDRWQLSNNLVYQGQLVEFALHDVRTGVSLDRNAVETVLPQGLSFAELSFSSPRVNEISAVLISVRAVDAFNASDSLIVSLPNFVNVASSKLTFTASPPSTEIVWNAAAFELAVFINEYISQELVISVEDFVIPAAGINDNTMLPSIAFNQSSVSSFMFDEFAGITVFRNLSFGPSPFSSLERVATPIFVNVSFTETTPNHWTDLVIDLSFSSLSLDANDEIGIFLPQFHSNKAEVVVESAPFFFTGEWDACAETLYVRSNASLRETHSLRWTVSALRLPVHGVSDDLASVISLSSNSSISGTPRFLVQNVQRVGYIVDSSLHFAPEFIDETTKSLVLQFQCSLPLSIGDTVSFTLPGVLRSTNCAVGSNVQSHFTIAATSVDLAAQTITFTSTSSWPENRMLSVDISQCVGIADEGFPAVEYPSNSFSVAVATAVGVIGRTEILSVAPVGIYGAHVHYEVFDVMRPVRIALQFFFTTYLSPGDHVSVFLPFINDSLSMDKMNGLSLRGDSAADNYRSYFSGSFDLSRRTLNLTCLERVPSRELTIFVEEENGLLLSAQPDERFSLHNATHFFSANISSLGSIVNRELEFSPKTISPVRSPRLEVLSCDAQRTCDVQIDFALVERLSEGEIIAISQANLNPSDASALQSLSSSFDLSWRRSDNSMEDLFLSSPHDIQLDPTVGGRLVVDSDVETLSVERTLSAANQSFSVSIVTEVPRVISFELLSQWNEFFCGDEIDLIVRMDNAVAVVDGSKVKLLLNTGETAKFIRNIDSSTLLFRYFVSDALVDESSLSVAGAAALEMFSFNQIVAADNPRVSANLTMEPPFELRALNKGTGFYDEVSVRCNATAFVTTVRASSPHRTWYSSGDVLDVNVVFSRDIRVLGNPQLSLLQKETGTTFVAQVMPEVSRTQYLHVHSLGFFYLEHANESTSCLFANDTASIADAVKGLSSLEKSLPLEIEMIADPVEYVYKLYFHGVAPSLLRFDNVHCDDRVTGFVARDPALSREVTFRYVISADDPTGNITHAGPAALQLVDNSNIFVDNVFLATKEVDVTLPDSDAHNSLSLTSNVWIDNDPPSVLSVSSDFSSTHSRPAQNGDEITVEVRMSAPVVVEGDILLPLNVSSLLHGNQTIVYASLRSVERDLLTFSYYVPLGDMAELLDTPFPPENALVLSHNAWLRRSSLLPQINASLLLPLPRENNGLSISMVTVNAGAFPVILRAFVNPALRRVTAGNVVSIFIEFSSNITITRTHASLLPSLSFLHPVGAKMNYTSGSGSSTLRFDYLVKAEHASGNLSFAFDLENGFATDLLGRQFTSLLNQQVTVDFFDIDTHAPTVLKVDCNCEDGVYVPGQVLDIFLLFDKEVYLLNVTSIVQLELFVHTQSDMKLLAQYTHGNGTRELHFSYLIPPANAFMRPQNPQSIDYAGTAALEKHIRGAFLTDVSPAPSTRADLFLPPLDRSYLAVQRRVQIDFSVTKVRRVFTVKNGTYTAGDHFVIAVEFSNAVMFYLPPPLLLLAVNPSMKKTVTATYLKGNNSRVLYFEYVVQAGDSTNALDYVDTRITPFGTSSEVRSFALISADNFKASFFDTPVADVFMASSRPNVRILAETALPLPGDEGSLSVTSLVVLDTTAPRIVSVQALVPSGTFGAPGVVPIAVEFQLPVVVNGCPYISFVINYNKRVATYAGGSGGRFLWFDLLILPTESVTELDYQDTQSLRLATCANSSLYTKENFIKRFSDDLSLSVRADLTLPEPHIVRNDNASAPRSLLSNGENITLSGSGYRPLRVSSSLPDFASLSFGDVLDVSVSFNGNFSVLERYVALTLAQMNATSGGRSSWENAFLTRQTSSNSLRFEKLIGPYDQAKDLSFNGTAAMYSPIGASCLFIDNSQRCVQHALPSDNGDELTPKHLLVVSSQERDTRLSAVDFVPSWSNSSSQYVTGDRLLLSVSFSEAVSVEGVPRIFLQAQLFDEPFSSAHTLDAHFVSQRDNHTLLFSHVLADRSLVARFSCGRGCAIDVTEGAIRRRNNWLPIVHAELDVNALSDRQCRDAECKLVESTLSPHVPHIVRVYSNNTGVISNGDNIAIFVEFSVPVRCEGDIALFLDLSRNESSTTFASKALFVDFYDSKTLLFAYTVRDTDYTSMLDYVNSSALVVLGSHSYNSAGIFFASVDVTIPANLSLPLRGAEGSLARESSIVVDQTRPNIVAVYTEPWDFTTCGDVLRVVVQYSRPMELVRTAPTSAGDIFITQNTLSLFLQPAETTLATRFIDAPLARVQDTRAIFEYTMSSKDVVGTISLYSRSPMTLRGFALVSQDSGIPGPDVWDDTVLRSINLPVTQNIPQVLRVYSENASSTDSYSAGDVLIIFVEMSEAVRVEGAATLALQLRDGVRYAQHTGMSSDNRQLIFSYEVEGGDRTDSLKYVDTRAFSGAVYQISACETPVAANMLLPEQDSPNSLSTCCRIEIISSSIFVESLIPVKLPGTYGENEIILIIARFTDKVVVRGDGLPYLLLRVNSFNDTARAAYYTAELPDYEDLSIAFSEYDLVFKYVVHRDDRTDSLQHAGVNALRTPPGTEILQRSSKPVFAVDLSLREPGDFSLVNGKVERQWKYRFPQKIDVLLRDIYHSEPQALTFTVEHLGKKAKVFSSSSFTPDVRFSRDASAFYLSTSKFNNYVENLRVDENPDDDESEDLFFADSTARNIANSGLATQSSTVTEASCAIDGEYSPYVGDGFVSQTAEEDTPWWQLSFPAETSVVQTIRIFERKPEQWITPVADLVLKGLDRYPVGFFRLNFTQIDPKDSSFSVLTDYIPMRATAEQVKAIISATLVIGNVNVVKTELPVCESGCGNGLDQGYGDKYVFTFSSLLTPNPQIAVTNIVYPGQPLDELSVPSTEVQIFPIVWYSRTVRTGRYVQVTKEYAYSKVDFSQANEWLTPFYVFVFSAEIDRLNDSSLEVPGGLNESMSKALWYQRYTSIDSVLTITLPRPITQVYAIKIQREGYGVLSLAEVEVYADALNTLSYYRRGSPVQSTDLNAPYAPETPFHSQFMHSPYDGRWLLELQQLQNSTGRGRVSEVVVVVTDLAGIVRAYYQDVRSVVSTLPRHGRLFSTISGSSLGYAAWKDNFGLIAAQQIESLADQSRYMGLCSGPGGSEGECEWLQGDLMSSVPQIAPRLYGDAARELVLRSERVVYYVPDAHFTGWDAFTYTAYNGLVPSPPVTAWLMVQECRQWLDEKNDEIANGFFARSSLLCDCAPSATSILGDDIAACEASREVLCADEMLKAQFVAMCSACYPLGVSGSNITASQTQTQIEAVESTACRAETIRAVSVLTVRGLCLFPADTVSVQSGDGVVLSVRSRAISDEQLVCLRSKETVSTSSIHSVKPNHLAFQANFFTTNRP